MHTGACPVQTAQRVGPRLPLDAKPQASHTHRRAGVRPGGLSGEEQIPENSRSAEARAQGLRVVLARAPPTEQPTPQLLCVMPAGCRDRARPACPPPPVPGAVQCRDAAVQKPRDSLQTFDGLGTRSYETQRAGRRITEHSASKHGAQAPPGAQTGPRVTVWGRARWPCVSSGTLRPLSSPPPRQSCLLQGSLAGTALPGPGRPATRVHTLRAACAFPGSPE